MKHLLIYHLPLNEADGTTVALQRLYAEKYRETGQIFFRRGRFSPPTTPPAMFVHGIPAWPFYWGARWLTKFWPRFCLPLLLAFSPRFRAFKRRARIDETTQCHVVVYDEHTAAVARRIVAALPIQRYVLHLMDLLDPVEPGPFLTPNLVALTRGAAGLVVISPRLQAAVSPFAPPDCLVSLIPSGVSQQIRRQPRSSRPWRVLFSGALYAGKAGYLESVFLPAWREFHARHSHTELVYLGADYHLTSDAVRAAVKDLGRVPPEQVGEILVTADVGLLPIIHLADSPWQYSVPARVSDYLAAGLPVLAPEAPGTATDDFFQSIGEPAVRRAGNSAAVLAALEAWHGDPELWACASAAAQDVARRDFDAETVRARFFSFLERQTRPSAPVLS